MSTARQSAQLLPLEGGLNFRDLGGYPSEDGRRIRWGQLFRSGTMHRLTDADYRHLETLGIKVVYDLRSTLERREAPTDWRAAPAEYLFRDYENTSTALADLGEAATADAVRELMIRAYVRMPTTHRDAYRELFARLVKADVPLVFNCAAGKDRTGVAAALVLSALEVRRDIIVNDFTALSETYVDYMAEIRTRRSDRTPDMAKRRVTAASGCHGKPCRRCCARIPSISMRAMLTGLDTSHAVAFPFLEAELGTTGRTR